MKFSALNLDFKEG